MSDKMKAGDKCLECAEAGLDHKLRYFYINLKEQILKCEHRTCLWPHNDEVSSDEEEEEPIVNDEDDDDDFLRNLLNFTMDNRETVVTDKLVGVLQTTTKSIPMEEQQAFNNEPEILKIKDLIPSSIEGTDQSENTKSIPMDEQHILNIEPEILIDLVPSDIESISHVEGTDQPANRIESNSNCYTSLSDRTGNAVGATQQSDPECYSPMTAVLPSLPHLTDFLFDCNPMVQLEPVTQSLEEPTPKDETSTEATATNHQLNEDPSKEEAVTTNTAIQSNEEPSKEEIETTNTATQLNEVQQTTKETFGSKSSSMPSFTLDFNGIEAITDELPKEEIGTTVTTSTTTQLNEVLSTKKSLEPKISSMPTIKFDFQCLPTIIDEPPKDGTGLRQIIQSNEVLPPKETSEPIMSSMPLINFDFNGLQPTNERIGTTIMEEPSKMPAAVTFDFSCLQPIIEVNLTKPQHIKKPTKRISNCKRKIDERLNAPKVNRGSSSLLAFVDDDDDDDSIPKAQISHYFDAIEKNEKLKTKKVARPSKTVVKKPISTNSESFKKLLELLKQKKSKPN